MRKFFYCSQIELSNMVMFEFVDVVENSCIFEKFYRKISYLIFESISFRGYEVFIIFIYVTFRGFVVCLLIFCRLNFHSMDFRLIYAISTISVHLMDRVIELQIEVQFSF